MIEQNLVEYASRVSHNLCHDWVCDQGPLCEVLPLSQVSNSEDGSSLIEWHGPPHHQVVTCQKSSDISVSRKILEVGLLRIWIQFCPWIGSGGICHHTGHKNILHEILNLNFDKYQDQDIIEFHQRDLF